MSDAEYVLVGQNYTNTGHVPKGKDLFYRCDLCGTIIPSAPKESTECECGNITIDTDYVRLAIEDKGKMSVIRKV